MLTSLRKIPRRRRGVCEILAKSASQKKNMRYHSLQFSRGGNMFGESRVWSLIFQPHYRKFTQRCHTHTSIGRSFIYFQNEKKKPSQLYNFNAFRFTERQKFPWRHSICAPCSGHKNIPHSRFDALRVMVFFFYHVGIFTVR